MGDTIETLKAAGFNMDNVFITQEGAVYDMDCATCPKCEGKCTLQNYKAGRNTMGANFLCPHCNVMFDEPIFEPAEAAYLAWIGDDED